MKSPFPGMDPYLEGEVWREVHILFASKIQKRLTPKVRPKYTVRQDIYTIKDPNPELDQFPLYTDVGIFESDRVEEPMVANGKKKTISKSAIKIPIPEPLEINIPSIVIRTKNDNRIVTAVEILSPANKRKPNLAAYLAKKQQFNYKKIGEMKEKQSRRTFLSTAASIGGLSILPFQLSCAALSPSVPAIDMTKNNTQNPVKSIIGAYGEWATELFQQPRQLSFRNKEWTDLEKWRKQALSKTKELMAKPDLPTTPPKVFVKARYEYDGLIIEELQWQLPYGPTTEAILLKPTNAKEPLPAVLGLHDHGGNKYFGKRKITKTSTDQHPLMVSHQRDYYSGLPWANELAKRGFVVLVHDVFTFGSRRIRYQDVDGISWGSCNVHDKSDENPELAENIEIYNQWATEHEHILAKSLFCAGTTWPALTLLDDQKALDVLCSRSDVDAKRVGCCGLSGGGLRTNYLGGLDHRIQCAVSVGFMSTWKDFIMNKSFTHTWMTYTPLLPQYLDFPEILGLRVPLPTLVLNDKEDELYTLSEMKKADAILQEIYAKAGAKDKYSGRFYPGGHKFDATMQQDSAEWFERWLK